MRASEITFADHGSFEIVSGCCAHRFQPHFHRAGCLLIITGGQAEVTVGALGQRLVTGEGVFIPPFALHALSPVKGAPYAYLTLCLKDKAGLPEQRAGLVSGPSDPRQPGFSAEAEAQDYGGYDYLRKAVGFISGLNGSFQLEDLCGHCHVSKFHLVRRFKKSFGLTPYQYYNNLRIGKIRRGLLAGQAPPDLAYALGFSDQSHMCNTFKKYMAVTPLQYLKSYRLHSGNLEKWPFLNCQPAPDLLG